MSRAQQRPFFGPDLFRIEADGRPSHKVSGLCRDVLFKGALGQDARAPESEKRRDKQFPAIGVILPKLYVSALRVSPKLRVHEPKSHLPPPPPTPARRIGSIQVELEVGGDAD